MGKNVSITKPSKEPDGTFPPDLLAEAKDFIALREKLIEAEKNTAADLQAVLGDIAAARRNLADAEIDAAIAGETANGASTGAFRDLAGCEARREKLKATLARLRERLAGQTAGMRDLVERFSAAQDTWAAAVWAQYRASTLDPALAAFRQTLIEARQIAKAVGVHFELTASDLDVGEQQPAEAYGEPWAVRARLVQFLLEAASEERMDQLHRRFDVELSHIAIPEGALYRVKLDTMASGKLLPRGAVISSDTLPPGLLRRLIVGRRVTPVSATSGEGGGR